MSQDLWAWSASELAAAIATGRVSSVEATDSALARMDAVNPALNAVVDPLAEAARKAAHDADAVLRRDGPVGPLHGVPVTVKVNVDYEGRPTTNGVVAYADLVAPEDGSVVRNLRAAGAVIIGRTNTPAYSMRWFTENDLHGATLNPHDPAITPGGSSGGAGAATAAGIGAMGHGNDIGGSIRYPAYCCGLYGLRPTSGLVPAYSPSQIAERPIVSQVSSVQGPHARSAADVALSMRALCAPDHRDVAQVPAPAGMFEPPSQPCRVAMQAETDDCPVDPAVSAAIREAGAILSEAGYEVVETPIPSMTEAAELWALLLGNEMRSGLWPLIRENGDDRVRHFNGKLLDRTPELDGAGFLKALAGRSTVLRAWQTFFQDYPLILTAVSWQLPFPAAYDQRPDIDFEELYRQQAPLTATPILGLPGLSAPIGTQPGRPLGVHLIANRFGDDRLIAAGLVLERASGPMRPVDPAKPNN